MPPSAGGAAIWSGWRPPSLQVDDQEGIALLREALIRNDYTSEGIKRVRGDEPVAGDDQAALSVALRRLTRGDPTATLVKLFHFGVRVDGDDAAAVLRPLELDRLVEMGLLAEHGVEVEALVHITAISGVFVATDRTELRPQHHDYVAPISSGTLVLGAFTTRRPIDSALDLGSGSGFQALIAAGHSRHVVAVDINPRALRYTQFNALLSARPNIEVREGSLFEPVRAETFDLIVSNPPYVISPDNQYAFQDAGFPGDTFAEGLVRALPGYLREGGFAHILVEWVIPPGEHWSTPLRSWVDGNGCDALLFDFGPQGPLDYAALWNRPLSEDPNAYAAAIDRWLEHFEQEGIEAIGWGAVALRRRSGKNWTATRERTLSEQVEPAAHHVERFFAAEDFLDGLGDDDLLDARVRLADDAFLDVEFTVGSGQRLVRRASLALEEGIRLRVSLDEPTLELVSRLDPLRPLREIVRHAANDEADIAEVEAAAARAIRRLVELGFVVPAD